MDEKPLKTPPAYLFALGRAALPEVLEVGGKTYRFHQLFKHDFFAATGMYVEGKKLEAGSEKLEVGERPKKYAVLKIQRTHHLFGFPMKWLGRMVAAHEIRIYEKLQGIQGVPAFLGRVGPTGFLHAFIPGEPLEPMHSFTPAFFEDLQRLLQDIHDRGVAYVDTNKRENILFGEDGRPWLIDFQISYLARGRWGLGFLSRWVLRRFQVEDWYHFYKHKTRLMPQACTPEELSKGRRQSFLIKTHRFFAQPIIRIRRKFLSQYKLDKTK